MKYKILILILFVISFENVASQEFTTSFSQGQRALNQGHYKIAIDHFSRALELNPKNASSHYQLARAYSKNNNNGQAYQNLRSAIQKDTVGFFKYWYLVQDTFFNSMHKSIEWKKIITQYENKNGGSNIPLFRDLVTIRIRDQEHRKKMANLWQQGKGETKEFKKAILEGKKMDSLNMIRINEIIDQYGYPGKDLVGEASAIPLLVIQHSTHESRKEHLPLLKKAVENRDISMARLALVIDRIQIHEGEKQTYGTQYKRNKESGHFEFYPIKDLSELDKRRAEAGLSPIKVYARRNNIIWEE